VFGLSAFVRGRTIGVRSVNERRQRTPAAPAIVPHGRRHRYWADSRRPGSLGSKSFARWQRATCTIWLVGCGSRGPWGVGMHQSQERPNGRDTAPIRFTPRQQQIIQSIADGLTEQEIARELGISPRTVRMHSDALRLKLGVPRRRQIPHAARCLGWQEVNSDEAAAG
jgi:DNA-binding CsgD family transcriptional regulator